MKKHNDMLSYKAVSYKHQREQGLLQN